VAAIGKGREGEQERKRRKSGVRRRDGEREAVDMPPMSAHPAGPPVREDAPRQPSQSDARSERGGALGPTDPRIREDDAASIEWLLDEASRHLSHMPDAPLCRELRLVVYRYRRAVREWTGQSPTEVQRAILLDCVRALHGRVVSRSSRNRSVK
jgi:hypothetical protein